MMGPTQQPRASAAEVRLSLCDLSFLAQEDPLRGRVQQALDMAPPALVLPSGPGILNWAMHHLAGQLDGMGDNRALCLRTMLSVGVEHLRRGSLEQSIEARLRRIADAFDFKK